MNDKKIPTMQSYEQIAAFWDQHSLADYWDQTESAEFEISPQARHRYLVTVDPDLFTRLHTVATKRGLSTESLLNLLLEQRLHEVELA
ncbi:MAG TPA: hypothetical protein ENJ56_04105 [Anaerolineae bacterium]|nr:hypothetical protein [Anaerolineae bacterium]